MSYNNKKNTPDADATGDIISWVVIFILMFAFPPVGLLLLIIKLRGYAKPAKNATKRTGTQEGNTSRSETTASSRGEAGAAARSDVEAAAREVGVAAREAAREIENVAREIASEFAGVARGAASQYGSATKQQRTEAYADTSSEFTQPQNKKAKKKKGRNSLDKKSGKFISTILLLISIALFIFGANTILRAALDILGNEPSQWLDLWLGVFYFAGAFIPLFSRNIVTRRFSRYKKYYAFVGDRSIVPIPDIARSAGLSAKTVMRDIQAMINSGYFEPGAYIDSELDSLVLSAEAAEAVRRAARTVQEGPTVDEAPENQYMAIILELRELNGTIIDIAISDKIDRIEELTAKIFRIVEEDPSKLPHIRRFMNYYLPTTLKLLRSYALLEKQGIKGENITASKENIGRILDTLATGFEQQLDQLFRSDAIDIAADINVLENLMQQDGLTSDKPELKTMEGTS
jgi:hypothetical protein